MYNIKELIIFLTVVLLVFFLSNFYIYKRIVQALTLSGNNLIYFRILFLLVVLSYPLSRILEGFAKGFPVNDVLNMAGSIWMGMMLYIILCLFLIDILRVSNYFFHFFPEKILLNKAAAGRFAFYAVAGLTVLVSAYGIFNARNIKIIEPEIFLNKLDHEKNPFIIVQVSDIHLGKTITKDFLFKITENVNRLDPDIVVFTGDVVDDGSADYADLIEPFSQIKSKFGKYFVSGNHDYFGNIREVENNISKAGVRVLNNEYVTIDSAVVLLGLDYTYGRKNNKDNRTISRILQGADQNLPVVLLKHVPDDIENISSSGVDLLLSGHTHHGQLFPFNFITDKVYKVSNGLGMFGNLQIYVNSGVGFWGPPMKVGVPSEITKIILKTNKK